MTENKLIHKACKYRGSLDYGKPGRLCNSYDSTCITSSSSLEVTCKACLRIIKSRDVPWKW